MCVGDGVIIKTSLSSIELLISNTSKLKFKQVIYILNEYLCLKYRNVVNVFMKYKSCVQLFVRTFMIKQMK